MLRTTTIVLLLCGLYSEILSQPNGLEVVGGILMNPSQNHHSEAGTIRWTGSDLVVWNDHQWISLTNGIAYKEEVTDIDGHIYPVVQVGQQFIAGKNLRTTRYRNGDPIPETQDETSWASLGSGAWSWYDNTATFDIAFGKLYNWYAVTDVRGLCPAGWSVLTKDQMSQLINSSGGATVAGGLLKETGNSHWNTPNIGASNGTGFSGRAAGHRTDDGTFLYLGEIALFGTQTEAPTTHAIMLDIGRGRASIKSGNANKKTTMSVRCIRN